MWSTLLIDITEVRLRELDRDLARLRLQREVAGDSASPWLIGSLRRRLAGQLAAFAVILHAEAAHSTVVLKLEQA